MKFLLSDNLFPPLQESLLGKFNFFELYPLDGGGNFSMQKLFGTLNDHAIAARLNEVMVQFGSLANPDFKRFERWRSIEKSCWLNRCYFLISLARTAWLKRDPALARTAKEVILHFHRTCPPPSDLKLHWERVFRRMNEDYNGKSREEIIKDETDVEYIWYDFQPGQRLISFLYTLYFIRDFDIFTREECSEITECLKLHVRTLYKQESVNALQKSNHQSVRVLALYWGTPLLEQDEDFEAIRELAVKRCVYEGLNLFLSSGLEYEISPSYHAFVLWHLRDFHLLASRRKEKIPPGYEAVIESAVKILSLLCRPDGKLLTINDSYQCDAAALIESMEYHDKTPDFAVINPGGIAVGRIGKCYAMMDVSAFSERYSHTHGGKNAPTILWDGIPIIDDAGCPDYDAPQFPKCKRSEWHSSMLVDGQGDAHQISLYGFDDWGTASFDCEWKADLNGGHSFRSVLKSTVPAWKDIVWTRKLTITENGVIIQDDADGSGTQHIFTLLFNLAPDVSLEQTGPAQWELLCGKHCGVMTLHTAESRLVSATAVTLENCQMREIRPATQLQLTFDACTHLSSKTELFFKDNFNNKRRHMNENCAL